MAVSLPTEFLRTLKLEAAELLTVIIERRNLGFFLDLSARGQSQTELPETTVRFPVEGVPQEGGLALRREGTEGIIPAQWDSATSLATAAISATGAYEVVFLEAAEGADQLGPVLPAEPENGGIPLLLTVGILACAAGAGSLWALPRKRGRG